MDGESPAADGAATRFLLNDLAVETSLPAGTRTLDFLRRHRRLRGTKEGCREGECGACSVLVGRAQGGRMRYRAAASCLLPLGQLAGSHVITVEGLGSRLTPVQKALCEHDGIQCGFCTPGIVMALTGFFYWSSDLCEQDALDALDGNICRCTGYAGIRRAVSALCAAFRGRLDSGRDRCDQLVAWGVLPPSCLGAAERLAAINAVPVTAGASPLFVGGATDLLVQQPDLVEKAASLRLVSALAGAQGIRVSGDELVIGAAVSIEELRQSPDVERALPDAARSLAEDLKLVASTPLRNRATIAGNLVNASPIGDLSIMLLALDARLTLASGERRRQLPLRRFFLGYRKVDLAPGEAVESDLQRRGSVFRPLRHVVDVDLLLVHGVDGKGPVLALVHNEVHVRTFRGLVLDLLALDVVADGDVRQTPNPNSVAELLEFVLMFRCGDSAEHGRRVERYE